jgi:hypothetical protein
MAMKKLIRRTAAIGLGLLLSVIALAGLETGTYISDLVATNPLTSDLASTGDDHIRLLKSTIKATFPNINGAVSATDEQLSLLTGLTGTVWTSANDGASSTLDADLLDGSSSAAFAQLSASNVFTSSGSGSSWPVEVQSNTPGYWIQESDASTNEESWRIFASSGQLLFQACETDASPCTTFLTIDRTATTVDLANLAATAVQRNGTEIGYLEIPQNAQTGNYTLVLGDSGKHIYHASGAGAGDTYTIPANASVAYAIGTSLTFINSASDTVSIAITSDTMTLAGTTTTGTRTLAQNGVATAIKVTSTAWIISGTGISWTVQPELVDVTGFLGLKARAA